MCICVCVCVCVCRERERERERVSEREITVAKKQKKNLSSPETAKNYPLGNLCHVNIYPIYPCLAGISNISKGTVPSDSCPSIAETGMCQNLSTSSKGMACAFGSAEMKGISTSSQGHIVWCFLHREGLPVQEPEQCSGCIRHRCHPEMMGRQS